MVESQKGKSLKKPSLSAILTIFRHELRKGVGGDTAMAKESLDTALKRFDERYYKTAEIGSDYVLFCDNFPAYIKKIENSFKKQRIRGAFEKHSK